MAIKPAASRLLIPSVFFVTMPNVSILFITAIDFLGNLVVLVVATAE